MNSIHSPLLPLRDRLCSFGRLPSDKAAVVLMLPVRIKPVSAGSYLIREGDVPLECCLLIDGYAMRSKMAANGNRQIVSFHLPGDLLDIQHLFLERADHDVQASTDATVGWLQMSDLRELIASDPEISSALWRTALIEASIYREWLLNNGRRQGLGRVAHLFCEFIARSLAAQIGAKEGIPFPFTQEEIGDATGLTGVHVNRMIRTLVDNRLIAKRGKSITVLDPTGLQQVADFDDTYLHGSARAMGQHRHRSPAKNATVNHGEDVRNKNSEGKL